MCPHLKNVSAALISPSTGPSQTLSIVSYSQSRPRGNRRSIKNSDQRHGARVRFRLARYRVSLMDFCQDSALLEVRMTFAFGNT